MCGIFGNISISKIKNNKIFFKIVIITFTQGPDDEGYF